jgi:uncharacterized RDD family membrane protein YckC
LFCAKCGKELPAGATFCPNCGAPVAGGPSAAPTGYVSGIDTLTKDQKAQEYWIWRLVAIVVDYIIVGIVWGAIGVAVAFPSFFAGGGAFFGAILGGFAFVFGIIFVLYFAVTESVWGASLGKRLFNLKVRSKTGSNPTFGEAFVRNISKIYWLLLLLDVIIGLALSKGYDQKYTDHLMGTTVVRP